MNAKRRTIIDKAFSDLEAIRSTLEAEQAGEQESFDNLSEGLQASERGQRLEECANQLQEAIDAIDTACSNLEDAKQ